MDLWNYFNEWCYDAWIVGYELDLDIDCGAEISEGGPDFTSNSMFDQ